MSRPSSTLLPAAAREHAWSALWERLLQVPHDLPEPEPGEHPDDETTAEDEASAA